jgi:hypothetical protein
MNTYNERLQQTVVRTLSEIHAQIINSESAKTTAEYALYYAQATQVTAQDKLQNTKQCEDLWKALSEQGMVSANQISNLLASSLQANSDVAAGTSNAAVAASNVQVAENAISVLAADMGEALAITASALSDSNVHKATANADFFIDKVAFDSSRIACDAMNSSVSTSEISIAEVLAQTQALKSRIESVFESVRTTQSNFSDQVTVDKRSLDVAIRAERLAEGRLKDVISQLKAMRLAQTNAVANLNYGLNISVASSSQIEVSFITLPASLPKFDFVSMPEVVIPDPAPKYYLALLPAQYQTTFTLDSADSLFSQRSTDATGSFTLLDAPHPGATVTELVSLAASNQDDLGAKDVFGNLLGVGSRYVAFLYIELSLAYKQFIGSFSDLLSAPSPVFVPATRLPVPTTLSCEYSSGSDGLSWATAFFNVPSCQPRRQENERDIHRGAAINVQVASKDANLETNPFFADAELEFRCILVKTALDPTADFLLSSDGTNKAPIYFNLNIAEQISPANYTVASVSQSPQSTFELVFGPGSTDDAGNLIRPDVEYQPFILAVANGDQSSQFVNILAESFAPIVVCRRPPQA